MQKEYLKLIKSALAKDLSISVYDGECWDVKRSTSYKAIKDSIESVEIAQLRLRDQQGNIVGWAQIIPDLDPEETISDHTYNELMCSLCNTTWDGE